MRITVNHMLRLFSHTETEVNLFLVKGNLSHLNTILDFLLAEGIIPKEGCQKRPLDSQERVEIVIDSDTESDSEVSQFKF